MTENEAQKEDVKNPPKVGDILWGEDGMDMRWVLIMNLGVVSGSAWSSCCA
jgi:hypothetical protein